MTGSGEIEVIFLGIRTVEGQYWELKMVQAAYGLF